MPGFAGRVYGALTPGQVVSLRQTSVFFGDVGERLCYY
ncbi:hypothetical protein BN1221_01682 [Brenneria goodwinii]|uniref:Uncharacterized protein n=1 Tax=Brenneria goodwinii TaxID=1109412 RepID=A0A0G4JTI8_9GAMM|nr:hypothetical protein BN1221_01682 [Brenneria goodwinii]